MSSLRMVIVSSDLSLSSNLTHTYCDLLDEEIHSTLTLKQSCYLLSLFCFCCFTKILKNSNFKHPKHQQHSLFY